MTAHTTTDLPGEQANYDELLGVLTTRIREAQQRAALAINRELVLLYWGIGREILARQEQQGWGARVVARLAGDLHRTFPGVRGFSERNLKYMRAVAAAWPDEAVVQQLLHKLPWFHVCTLLESVRLSRRLPQ